MGKRLINTYIKYTAKKPVLVFVTIGIFLFVIFFVSLTTKTNIIQTYDGIMAGNTIVINAEIRTELENIYVYENKNEAVYLINVIKIEKENNSTVLFIDSIIELNDAETIKLDIPIGEISLFERVFLKGGKVNG